MKRFFSPIILRTVSGALLLTLGLLSLPATRAQQPQAQKAGCPRTNDEIVKDIYEQLKNHDVFKTQWRQIIVTANKEKEGVIRLRGWVKGDTAKRNVEKLIEATACVTKVNSQLSLKRTGSCPEGQQACGDGGCIGANETCPVGN